MTSVSGFDALPAELTAFVGRDDELAAVRDLLATARLVTVTGPGGVGKTRLALRAVAGARADGEFADGVCLVELSSLVDATLLPDTVAAGLGLADADARSQLDAVVDYLRERRVLLILDTSEHLLDACAMIADVLIRNCPRVTVLVTGRQALDVPGEHVFQVAPLSAEAAVELFVQCAASVLPGFVITPDSREHVERVCARLDGVPLAIELAAVRLRAIPAEQLADRLDDRFRLLTGGRRGTLPHHQTLRTATEWSYNLCTPAEQALWARLSVFAGPFDLVAAEEVCADGELAPGDVVEALVGLVDKSVVLRTGQDRYRLLDTIRDYGAQLLTQAGQQDVVRQRHMTRYAALASYFGYNSQAEDQRSRFHQLRAEHADLRAALDFAFRSPSNQPYAAAMPVDLWGYWLLSGRLKEGDYWLGKVLERYQDPAPERARAMIFQAALGIFHGKAEQAVGTLAAATEMAAASGDAWALAAGSALSCLALTTAGRYPQALAACDVAEPRAAAIGLREALALIGLERAQLHLIGGQVEAGIADCDAALLLFGPDSRELWMRSFLYLIKGLGLCLKGDLVASMEAFALGLTLKYEVGDTTGLGYALEGMALVAGTQQRDARAAWLFGAAERLWQLVGGRFGGDAFLEALHQQYEQQAIAALGDARFGSLFRRGELASLDQVVAFAVSDADELPAAVRVPASRPDSVLTGREHEIAGLVAEGLSNREIAERLVISKRTVDAHIEHIYDKLGISSRVQLATWLRAR